MRSISVPHDQAPYFVDVWATYEASFPLNERRSFAGQHKLFLRPEYRFDAWLDGETFVGLLAWWDFGSYRYIEHLAIAPNMRSCGYGKKIVDAFLQNAPTQVRLEIETPVDELTRRRLGFYQRLGFVENKNGHVQPPYQYEYGVKDEGVRLEVLSWPRALTAEEQKEFLETLHTVVWADVS